MVTLRNGVGRRVCVRGFADERVFRGSPEPGADVIREMASMSAPVGRTPLPTKWSE